MGRLAAHGRQGSVYLDLGNPCLGRAPCGVLVGLSAVALAMLMAPAVPSAASAAIALTGSALAVVMLAAAVCSTQALCQHGVVTPDQFIAWPEITGYRFLPSGVDLLVRLRTPLFDAEMTASLAFPEARRPEVEHLIRCFAPHAGHCG